MPLAKVLYWGCLSVGVCLSVYPSAMTLWWHSSVLLLFDVMRNCFDVLGNSWRYDELFDVNTNFLTSRRICDVIKKYVCHDVSFYFIFDVMTTLLTSWRMLRRSRALFAVMTNFLMSWHIFDIMTHFLIAWKTCWQHEELFDVRVYFLRHDKLFDVMVQFLRHDELLTLGRIFTSWRTFLRHGEFLTSWRTF